MCRPTGLADIKLTLLAYLECVYWGQQNLQRTVPTPQEGTALTGQPTAAQKSRMSKEAELCKAFGEAQCLASSSLLAVHMLEAAATRAHLKQAAAAPLTAAAPFAAAAHVQGASSGHIASAPSAPTIAAAAHVQGASAGLIASASAAPIRPHHVAAAPVAGTSAVDSDDVLAAESPVDDVDVDLPSDWQASDDARLQVRCF